MTNLNLHVNMIKLWFIFSLVHAFKIVFLQSGKASLGEGVYQAIAVESISVEEILLSLNLTSEHKVLETVNRLEGAVFAWKQRMAEETSKRSPMRYAWYFGRDFGLELEKTVVCSERAEALLQILKIRFPNLPQSFIDVTKVRYNKVRSSLLHFGSLRGTFPI